MRKLVFKAVLIGIFCLNSNLAFCNISAITRGYTTVSSNSIFENLLLTVVDNGTFTISATVNAEYITNLSNSNIKIPISKLSAISSTGTFQLACNVPTVIYSGTAKSSATISINFKLEDTGNLPSGTYQVPIKFTSKNQDYNFTINYIIPITQDITSTLPNPTITVGETDIFKTSFEVQNEIDSQINISSNCPWKLLLNTNLQENPVGEYSYQVISGNNLIFSNEKMKLEQNKIYEIAKGEKTISDTIPTIPIKTNLRIRYYLKNTSNEYLNAGNIINNLTYRIEAQ